MTELRPTLMPIKDYELGYNEGRKIERQKLINEIRDEIARFENTPELLGSIDATGIYLGLKKAELLLKESKWT